MRVSIATIAVAIMASLLTSACLRTGETRADRDTEVGHASGEGLQVVVEGGLAAVRELSPGKLRLWGSAPTLELTVVRDAMAGPEWELLLDNCMPGARLTAPEGVQVAPKERTAATRCGWSLRLPANESVRLTIAPPGADGTGPIRFGVLSDVQADINDFSDIVEVMNRDRELTFVISTGDLTEDGSAEQFRRFQSELSGLDVPFFSTLGNHDLSLSDCRFQDYFGRGSFHFAYRDVHFTMLDSAGATIDPIVYDWLDGWLEQGRGRTHVVAMHVPPVDPVGLRNGGFASRNEAALVLARLAEAGVDLTLYGHLHSYYRFYNAGIEAHVSGGGGAYPERYDGIGRHYLTVDVDDDTGDIAVSVVRID